ncbi:MAG: ComEC family competence protein, partial [Alphaproteobacteria bacterium]|nr:ComEC family competence protein [Alphaproteobacteria bacterium]
VAQTRRNSETGGFAIAGQTEFIGTRTRAPPRSRTNPAAALAVCVGALRAACEAQRGRAPLFLPVGFGAGIVCYFGMRSETEGFTFALWFVFLFLLSGFVLRVIPRVRWLSRFAFALALVAAGFFLSDWHTELHRAPRLDREYWGVNFSGRVVRAEPRDENVRVVLDSLSIEGVAEEQAPRFARVTMRRASLPMPGTVVAGRAVLRPPFAPRVAGDPDFARRDWFLRVGAVGYTLGAVERLRVEEDVLRWQKFWHRLRYGIVARVDAVLPESASGLASALLAGARGRMPEEDLEAVRVSGLAHLLAISGLHIGLVTGTVYGFLRLLLALHPVTALKLSTHKWSLLAALAAGLMYLFLAGATLPTQRAFGMFTLLAFGVFLNRRALSLYLVAWVAFVILIFQPESLLSVGFQMSFASVTALIAVWEWYRLRHRANPDDIPSVAFTGQMHLTPPRVVVRKVMIYFLGISLTTVVASSAVLPLSFYHFGRGATYSLIANIVAIPVTALWIMPVGLFSIVAMPFGLEAIFLRLMEPGLDLVLRVAYWVADLPGSQAYSVAGPRWTLVLYAAGAVWLLLLRGRVRLLGLAPILVFAFIWAGAERPFLLAAADGSLVAIVAPDGSGDVALYSTEPRSWPARVWSERLGGIASRDLEGAGEGGGGSPVVRCDAGGCVADLGVRVSLLWDVDSLGYECATSAVVLVPKYWSDGALCRGGSAVLVDRRALADSGGLKLWRFGEGLRVERTCDVLGDRPWLVSVCDRE